MGFRRGDIVWARVVFPDKWWPALVQSTRGHRVAVSFFDAAGKSRYFLETEVCSFEENFDSLVKTVKSTSRGGKLLEFALILIARRAAYGLKCRCHFRPLLAGGSGGNRSKIRDSFWPDKVLSFVAGLAVSPLVGDSDFVGAVTFASQFNVFRRYVVFEQKLRHEKTTGSCSVAQSLDVSEMGIVCVSRQESQEEFNLTCSSSERFIEDNLPVPIVSSYAPSSTPQEAQRSKCASTLMDHRRDKQDLLVKASRHERTDAVVCFEESSWENNSRGAETSKMERSTCIDNHEFSVKKVGQDCSDGTFSSKESCFIDLTVDRLAAPLVTSDGASFPCPEAWKTINASTEVNHMDHCRDSDSISVKVIGHKRVNPKFTSDAVFRYEESLRENNSQSADSDTFQMEHSTSIGNHGLSVKNVRRNHIEGTKKRCCIDSTANRLLVPLVTSDAPSSTCPEAEELINASTEVNHVDHCRDSPKIPVKAIGRKRIDPECTSKESPTKKSKVDKQSARTIYRSCQNLYMKFPRDFKLPSKMDLLKKFSRFGQIDLVRTKVFERMGSAQVFFLHPFDAMTAYQYAKFKRSLFHGALVLYWLDRYEQKRTHSRFVAPLPKLKPCLKSPFLRGKEEKKPARKVRFSM